MYQLGTDMACIPSILTKIANMLAMAIRVVEFSNGGYKFRKIFA